jgi:hypothetical protein
VYSNRDNVTELVASRRDGRTLMKLDFSAVTRYVLLLRSTADEFMFDTAVTADVVTGNNQGQLIFDLSDYDMPEGMYQISLIAYDAEHLSGQVILDGKIDSTALFSLRAVPGLGVTPPPGVEYVTEAPSDDVTYGRKNGIWVDIDSVVAGVSSVNGETGTVVLDAADVGAEATGAVDAGVAAHVADTTPHETLLSLDRVGFSMTPTTPAGAGEVVWNDTDKTLDIGLGEGVVLQAGQEVQIRGLNNSGSTMLNGFAVYISGATGNRLVFSQITAAEVTADKTIAVLTQDILNNQSGQATAIGLVRDLDTSAFAEGSELWLSATVPGGLTNVKPPAPNNATRIGYVVRSHATTGSIFVRIQILEAMTELHDVVITAPDDGDILEYDTDTSTWINVPNTGGGGEVNTASNLGGGVGVFAQKVDEDLQFKGLVAGTNITLTPSATGITIDATGVGGGAVDSVNGETGVVVLDTDDIDEGGSNLYFTNGRASAAAPVQTVDGQTGTVSLTASYAPLSHVGDTGAAHGDVVAAGAAGFMTGADKTKLDGVATEANLYVHPNHSGDVTSVADGAQTIAANAVTNTKAADMAVNTIKGRITAGTGDPEDLTATQVRTIINVADGATANSSDATLLARANHTGTQLSSTISDFDSATRAQVEAELVAGTNITITPSGSGATRQLTIDASGGGSLAAVATFTGNKTLALTDINTYNVSQDGTAQEVTVPAQSTVTWTADAEIHIEQGGAGVVTVTGATGVTINGVSAGSFDLAGQFSAATLKRTGSDSWTLIFGAFAYNRENILGTVSESAGVPTGAIIERGSNANGEYVRYADGTQICTFAISETVSITSASGYGGYLVSGAARQFPAEFVTVNAVSLTPANAPVSCGYSSIGGTSLVPLYRSITSVNPAEVNVSAIVIGHWF